MSEGQQNVELLGIVLSVRLRKAFGFSVLLMVWIAFLLMVYFLICEKYTPAVILGLFDALLASLGWPTIIKHLFPPPK